jgi:hypothetical protein
MLLFMPFDQIMGVIDRTAEVFYGLPEENFRDFSLNRILIVCRNEFRIKLNTVLCMTGNER